MAQEPPTELVIEMLQKGTPNEKIIESLQDQGYSFEQISEALTQAETKISIEGIPEPSANELKPSILDEGVVEEAPEEHKEIFKPKPLRPSFSAPDVSRAPEFSRSNEEKIEEIAESIISEKWQKAIEDIGDLSAWKEKVKTDITAVKQELLRLEARFDNLQQAILGKISEYDKSVNNLGADIQALEKLLQNIMKPLATNVKDLQKITERLKR